MALLDVNGLANVIPPQHELKGETGVYVQALIAASIAQVELICRRKLEAGDYTEHGRTIPSVGETRTSYVFYLREPRPDAEAFVFADFTTMKKDGIAVVEADVTVEHDRLIFSSAGRMEVVYAGGVSDTSALNVIKIAIGQGVMILHVQGVDAGVKYISGGGAGRGVAHGETGWASVVQMLRPFTNPPTIGYPETDRPGDD